MTIAEICELIGLIFTGIGLVISLIKLLKEFKDKKLKAIIEEKMAEAEQLYQNGSQRKAYVISQVLHELGDYSSSTTDKISKYIEELINFSKQINYKK